MKDKITKNHIDKYIKLTEKALKIATENINQKNKQNSKKILEMVEAYLSDSKYFKEKNDYINSFAAINYAHGWLDSGARLGIFDVKDDKLFTIK